MTLQYATIEECLRTLSKRKSANQDVINLFEKRMMADARLTRDSGASAHFCAVFSPISRKYKKIFIGHHIKSDSWLSPGGHIDNSETPVQTVIRECEEELGHVITDREIMLFSLMHFTISNRENCTEHFDLWYLVNCEDLVPFVYDRGEFFEAGWLTIDEALQKKSFPEFKAELSLLKEYIAS